MSNGKPTDKCMSQILIICSSVDCMCVCVSANGVRDLVILLQALCCSVCIMVRWFVVCLHFIKTTASAIIPNDEEVIFFPLFHCSQHLKDEACHNRTSCTGHENKNLSLCGKETDCIRFFILHKSFQFRTIWPFWNMDVTPSNRLTCTIPLPFWILLRNISMCIWFNG